MNMIDIIIIIIIILFAWQGLRRGFIIGLATLVSLILGIYAALYYSDVTANWIKDNFSVSDDNSLIIAYIATFLLIVIIVFIIGKILEKFIDRIALGFLNKIAGLIFGVIKAVILISIAIALINHYRPKWISEEKKAGSFFYGHITPLAPFLWDELNHFYPGKDKENAPENDKKKTIT
jgi:membrane protein required for colicin V production